MRRLTIGPYGPLTVEQARKLAATHVGAMAKGASISRHRIITGTVTVDGRIGPVGVVALKVAAAHQAGVEMFLVSAKTPSMGEDIGTHPGGAGRFGEPSVSGVNCSRLPRVPSPTSS